MVYINRSGEIVHQDRPPRGRSYTATLVVVLVAGGVLKYLKESTTSVHPAARGRKPAEHLKHMLANHDFVRTHSSGADRSVGISATSGTWTRGWGEEDIDMRFASPKEIRQVLEL